MDRDDARAAAAASFQKHNSGDRDALSALVPIVHDELRRAARELDAGAGRSSNAAGALSALYLRVSSEFAAPVTNEATGLSLCARAMRRVVVDYMAGDGVRERLTGTQFILDLDAALEIVERVNPRLARVVECRYFAGLTEEETARALEVDVATVRREWTRARGWTLRALAAPSESGRHDAPIPNAAWVDAVFDDALALTPAELEPFLERCRAAPGELRARVEELLRFSSATKPRLEPGDLSQGFIWSALTAGTADEQEPVADVDAASPRSVQEPATLVPGSQGWRIVRELHRGSLGHLYLAERSDRPSWPRGALRFVPGGTEADLAALLRRPDWRALSSLTHPGIARLIDAGRADDGRLYIVSEFIEGRPLDRFCDGELLTVDDRLELFVKVCQAVQHAHRKLAVHGRIKPSNIVVTADGEVKLLDFGVAGLLPPDASNEPDTDRPRVPSAEFSSPEQVRGEPLAVASDVYQLGLVLYVLLTGERPQAVDALTAAAVEEVVCDTVPARPSAAAISAPAKNAALRRTQPRALARKLRGDLDAIVMYALRKDPDRRYPSVSLLRSDVQRYRQRQPVFAQGDRLPYRLRKFVVRRWAPIAATVVLLTVGAAALPGPILGRLSGPSRTAGVAEVEQLIVEIFAQPAVRSGVEPSNVLHVEQAARMARIELAAHPDRQARLFTEIGRAYAVLGYYQRAISILEEALALRQTHTGRDSLEVAETLAALGESRHLLARYDDAETDLRTVVGIREVRLGSTHPDTISAASALGALLYSRGRFLEAEGMLRDTVDSLRPERRKAAADAPVSELLPRALGALANVVRDRGALGEAAVLYREAISVLGHDAAASWQVAALQVDFSRALVERAELDRGEAELARALPALRRAHPDDHPLVAAALRDYGLLRMEQGRLEEAHQLLSEALRIQEQWLGRAHPFVPRTRALLAELARRGGRTEEAVTLATAALKDFDRLGMPDHPWTVDMRATLADALIALGRHEEALRVLRPALTSAPRVFVSYDARLARLQDALARASRGQPDAPGDGGLTGSAP